MTPHSLSSYFSTKNLGNLAAIILTMRNSFRLRCLLAIAGSTYAEARLPLASLYPEQRSCCSRSNQSQKGRPYLL
jgi:hypothetical protein